MAIQELKEWLRSIVEGGSGSVSATDGVTTVDPATSIVFPSGTLSDLGSGVAGVGLVTRLVGPYTIHHDDARLQEEGKVLEEFPAGTWLVAVSVVVTETFSSGTLDVALSSLVDGAADYWNKGFHIEEPSWCAVVPDAVNKIALYNGPVGMMTMAGLLVDGGLIAAYYPDDTSTSGIADIYAIIAAPAS